MDQQRLVDVLRRFAGTLTGEFELVTVFDRLADEIRQTMQVEGAGVMLADKEGNLRFTSSDDPLLAELERLQVTLDEGPCLAAYRSGERVIASDLKTDDRFPEFGPRAAELGMRAVYSFPMRWENQVVGALNFYRADESGLSDDQIRSAETLADIATAYLVHGRQYDEMSALTSQLQGALDSRIPIEQAKGFLAAQLDLSVDDAFQLLRRYARSRSRRLAEVAAEVVDRRLSPEDLPQ